MLLTYGIRWYGGDGSNSPFNVCNDRTLNCSGVKPFELWFNAMIFFYLWWSVLYFLVVFLCLGSYIERKQYHTLWDRILTMGSLGRFFKKLLAKFPKVLVQAVYLGIHLMYSSVGMGIAVLLFYHQLAHVLYIACLLGATAWNAAEFYLKALSPMYATALEEKMV